MPLEPLTPTDPGTVGPHRLLGRLGQGGMGTVYLALTPDDRAVAVKVLRDGPSSAEGRRRFRRELEVLQRVRGPHLVEVLGGDAEAPTPWLVTRFVPGTRLDEVVERDGPLPMPALARVALGVARALQALHAAGIVHRDLTPGNVLLVDGEPHVIDLGLAVVADVTALTRSGLVVGTAGYLAPEQVLGTDCGPATDVHAWGATLALAATGRPPYGVGRPEAVLYRVVHSAPDLSGVPDALAPLVARAMHSDCAARPRVRELAEELERLVTRDRDLVGVGSGPHALPPGLRSGTIGPVRADDLTGLLGADVTRVLGREVTEALRRPPAEQDTTTTLPQVPMDEPTTALPRDPTAQPRRPDERSRAAAPHTAALPLPAPASAGSAPVEPDAPSEASGTARQVLLAVPGLALLAALALLAPVLVPGGAVLALLLLQTATRSDRSARRRVERRGPRRRDPLVSVLAAPWQVLGAAADLLLGLPLLLVAAALPAYAVAESAGGDVGLARAAATATVLGVVLTLSRQRFLAATQVLDRAGAGLAPRARDAAAAGVLVLVAAGLLGVAAADGPHWWPLDTAGTACAPLLTCP